MNTSMNNRTIVAFFDSREAAQRTIEKLVRAGVARTDINMVEGERKTKATSASTDTDMGFWESLKELFLPEEDRYSYAEGLRRGGYLVSVRTSDARYGQVLDILDDEGAIDMDQREAAWRKEGWTGYQAGADVSARTSSPPRAATGAKQAAATGAEQEQRIPVIEEQLRVGKRAVEQGRVRLRSYVVETPVQEQVNLRQEHVTVERRPVDRPVTGADTSMFKDRTIEAEERSEKAVVSKEARVKEEIAVRKDVEERTETISDKVRRTEVDVVDERGAQPEKQTSR